MAARIRPTAYVTRSTADGPELLIFRYSTGFGDEAQLPGGGLDPGERVDDGAVRETVEETGITGSLTLAGIVGVHQGVYSSGLAYVAIYCHLLAQEPRRTWRHVMIGDPEAWDTGVEVVCEFLPLAEARQALRSAGHGQDEFLDLLRLPLGARSGI